MSGSTFQRETWEISQVIHLPDSVLAITEYGGGAEAGEREIFQDKNCQRRKLMYYGVLARTVNESWGT